MFQRSFPSHFQYPWMSDPCFLNFFLHSHRKPWSAEAQAVRGSTANVVAQECRIYSKRNSIGGAWYWTSPVLLFCFDAMPYCVFCNNVWLLDWIHFSRRCRDHDGSLHKPQMSEIPRSSSFFRPPRSSETWGCIRLILVQLWSPNGFDSVYPSEVSRAVMFFRKRALAFFRDRF